MVKNLGSYLVESIRYKKNVTDNIMVTVTTPNGNAQVKLSDEVATDYIKTKVDEIVKKMNRGKDLDSFTNKITGGSGVKSD